ncbi:VOC family protein [Conexibacter sp. SYSU D00693]|uniref:VOC family protein n=1 Tax=Conexibacter sp. SYSU D00693 TaxID=2812560 RepID=UPI00196B6218|nr:VOC family protein [Conexibacter sp. SYSU D00693]
MLQHVALELREDDVEAEAAFWALLGFARVDPPAGLRDRSVWVQRGEQQIHLLLADTPVVPPQGHVAVVAEDHAATVATLRDAGHEVEDRARHWGAARCFARTPAGHRVEVMEFAPS